MVNQTVNQNAVYYEVKQFACKQNVTKIHKYFNLNCYTAKTQWQAMFTFFGIACCQCYTNLYNVL